MHKKKISKGIANLYGAVSEPIQPKGTIDDKLNDIIRRLERIECFIHQAKHRPPEPTRETRRIEKPERWPSMERRIRG
jgi:hypothetical protein